MLVSLVKFIDPETSVCFQDVFPNLDLCCIFVAVTWATTFHTTSSTFLLLYLLSGSLTYTSVATH